MSLADFLIPHRQQLLLAALLLHPERSYGYNELIKIAGAGRGASQNALRALLQSGVVVDTRVGNQHRFQANPRFPLYPELRAICVKSFGVQERIHAALIPLSDEIEIAFLFGSAVTGKDRADSDIDLFVVGTVDLLRLNAALEPVESELVRSIDVNLYRPAEWQTKRANTGLHRILTGPKQMVIGDASSA